MARFHGAIGFAKIVETRPAIFEEKYVERDYKGDIIRNTHRWVPSDYLNDNIDISNDISIIADTYAYQNIGVMRYVRWLGQEFEITSAVVDNDRHRITLTLGGVFNLDAKSSVSKCFDE